MNMVIKRVSSENEEQMLNSEKKLINVVDVINLINLIPHYSHTIRPNTQIYTSKANFHLVH